MHSFLYILEIISGKYIDNPVFYVALNFVRCNELAFDVRYGSMDGFFFNASDSQWEERGARVLGGWVSGSVVARRYDSIGVEWLG